MDGIREHLAEAVAAARGVVDGMRSGDLRVVDDDPLVAVLGEVAAAQRLLDAAMVAAVEETTRRGNVVDAERRLTHRFGCASISELVQRETRVSAATAGKWQKITAAVEEEVALSGELLPARLPALRDALLAGEVGVDAALAIAGPLVALRSTVSKVELAAADAALAATARGDDGPPPSADLLRVHAQAWAEALDKDGAEPRDARHARHARSPGPAHRGRDSPAGHARPRGRRATADPLRRDAHPTADGRVHRTRR